MESGDSQKERMRGWGKEGEGGRVREGGEERERHMKRDERGEKGSERKQMRVRERMRGIIGRGETEKDGVRK